MNSTVPAPARGATLFMVAVSVAVIAFGWWLPLADVWTYPTRISVLPSLQVDAATYDELGASIAASGRWTDVPPMQPPGFVVIMALVYRVFGHSLVAAKVLLWLCLVASTLLCGWLARRVWAAGDRPAWVAMCLCSTAPALRHYVGTLQYEVVAGTGLLVVLGLALKAAEGSTRRALVWGLAAGLAGGALTLVREVFIGIVPIIGLWMAATAWSISGARRATALLVLFMALFAASVVWWSALQSSRHGRIIVMTDKGASALALGNNPRASGTYNVDVIEPPEGRGTYVRRNLRRSATAISPVARCVQPLARGGTMPGRTLKKLTVMHSLLILGSIVLMPSLALAQGPGVRGGVSIDPDQFYFGGHFETGALVDRVYFRPNIEAGIGNDLTLVALNFEFAYKFPRRNGWQLYAGGGPAVNFYSFDRGPGNDRESNSEAGLNFLLGVEHAEGLFFEFKIGALDSPELKFGVGWTFR